LPKHVLLPHSIIELADFVKHPFHVFLNVMWGSIMLCTSYTIWPKLASILVRTIILF
jgi:hypothetical protein